MKTRTRNQHVAIIANASTLAKRNAEAADGSPKGSYAVAASPPRVTRSNSAKGAPSPKSGNDRVADPVEESKASPPVPAEGASPVRGKHADVEALLLAKEKEVVAPAPKSGNDRVADPAEKSKAAPPPSPGGARPVHTGRGKGADVEALLLARDKEIAALKQELVSRDVVLKGPKITVSTEAANVPPDSKDYWIDASAKKEKKTSNKIVVKYNDKPKDKPKADSTTGLKWKGYCVEGCGCAVCVEKREEPSKTAMLNMKRVSKKPST
jgi:hypothetical protein